MNTSDVFILIGIIIAVIVWALWAFAPKTDETEEEVDDEEFSSLDGAYADMGDFQVASDALRDEFTKRGKSHKYFQMLDYYEDQVRIKMSVREHYHALKRNTDKKIKKNDYGAVIQDTRADEVIEFLQSVGFQGKIMNTELAVSNALDALHDFTLQMESFGFDASTIPEDGFQFESWVATNLKKFGWEAEPTQGSGDQGLDVIATKNGCRVGIQCKLYSSNVGNKAVQEINAAKSHFGLDKVAVLTNAGYTKSARELAQTCDVRLLSHYDIPRFDELFLDEIPN